MKFLSKERMELFEESLKDGPKVAADVIQDAAEEAGKGRGLGAQTKKRKTPNFAVSGAGDALYEESQRSAALLQKTQEDTQEQQSQGINDILAVVMSDIEKETKKSLPKGDTLGETNYLTQKEKKQRGRLGPVAEKLMTAKESGSGGYDALYDQAQKGTFKEFKPTEMTIGEVLEFQKKRGAGSYASFVKANNPKGTLSTPVGKFQYVGRTLQDEVDNNDYDLNTKFDKGMQDTIFYNHANRIIKNLKTQEGKRSRMRSTWEGFKSKKSVSDEELDALISEIEDRK